MLPYIRITVSTYSLLVAIGGLVSASYLYYRSIIDCECGISFRCFLYLCVFCITGCLIGSKLLFTITQIPQLMQDFSFWKILKKFLFGGFVFYGGLFGAVLGCNLYSKIFKCDTQAVLNLVSPMFALFHSFGRIGCLFAGCCYGFKLKVPLQIGMVVFNYFPLQAIESVFEFIMFIILSKKQNCNYLFSFYVSVYAVYRFIIEFFRGDIQRGIWFGISTSQWISISVLIYFFIKALKSKEVF